MLIVASCGSPRQRAVAYGLPMYPVTPVDLTTGRRLCILRSANAGIPLEQHDLLDLACKHLGGDFLSTLSGACSGQSVLHLFLLTEACLGRASQGSAWHTAPRASVPAFFFGSQTLAFLPRSPRASVLFAGENEGCRLARNSFQDNSSPRQVLWIAPAQAAAFPLQMHLIPIVWAPRAQPGSRSARNGIVLSCSVPHTMPRAGVPAFSGAQTLASRTMRVLTAGARTNDPIHSPEWTPRLGQ
jgi:hypothetical protein